LKLSVSEIERLYSEASLKATLLENERNNTQQILDQIILKQAETAFIAYMNEQSATFSNIARTYGKNVKKQ